MSYETNDKMVSHPDHYKSGKYEVIDIIDEFTKDLSGTEAVCTANAIKYILRWKKKNGVQDLKKAVWYLTHLIEQFADAEPTGKEMFTPGVTREVCGNCKYFDAEHMNLLTGFGTCTFFGTQMNHQIECCGYFDDVHKKPDIDDEPEKLELRKNAAGVYIPEDKSESFMNLPYDELLKQCEEYKIAYEHLEVHFQDAVDNIHLLEEEVESLRREKDHMLNQLENRTKHINRQFNDNQKIIAENNRLAAQNDILIGVIRECRSRLRNCKYSKKDIVDWLEPYSGK